MSRLPLHRIVLPLTAAAAAWAWLHPASLEQASLPLFALVMLTTGLPHGATDHLVSDLHSGGRTGLLEFLLGYLAAVAGYVLIWVLAPLPGLLLFLAISSWHFGQSHWLELPLPEGSRLKQALYLTHGAWVLAAVILLQPETSSDMLAAILPQGLPERQTGLLLTAGAAALHLALLGEGLRRGILGPARLMRALAGMLLLGLLCWQAPLAVSFALYFGGWHAPESIRAEMAVLRSRRPGFGLRDFIRAAVPFSLISIAGIALLLAAGIWLQDRISPWLLFFIAVSALTLPHVWHMNLLYRRADGLRSGADRGKIRMLH